MAFFWRDTLFNVALAVAVNPSTPNTHAEFIQASTAADEVWAKVAAAGVTGTYVNYPNQSLGTDGEGMYLALYYGGNLERLS